MQPNRLVFLDFDGVLTSDAVGGYMFCNSDEYTYDPYCLDLLKQLLDRCNAKVIIASNWRRYEENGYWIYEGQRYYNPLGKLSIALKDYIVGQLPARRRIKKSEALVEWFNDTKFNGDYVIFEDDACENYQVTEDFEIDKHLVLTDFHYGITEDDIAIAEKILMKGKHG